MSSATFKDIPELFEHELGEILASRKESLVTFRELGPPDLCYVVKSTGKSGQKDLGSYHYVSGVDASSPAPLAAYIKSLTSSIATCSSWFARSNAWKVRGGCYCCFNAFSRVDIHVDVKIPGSVSAYIINPKGERHEATPEIWRETYLSAILRAILYNDDFAYRLAAHRRFDPITTKEGEIRFLEAAEAMFPNGWQTGTNPEIQIASVVSNHLTSGILKYFGDSFRVQEAANLFEKVSIREPEVVSLLAKSYIDMNEEVKAVQIMAVALREDAYYYTLLHTQCDFLRSKGKYDWALKLAKQAVTCAPCEFVTWEKLATVYIELGKYESALLTLNSCPMFAYSGRDTHQNTTPSSMHLPHRPVVADILPERSNIEDDETDIELKHLLAHAFSGTWARAYGLLARLALEIGWENLLRIRSAVFHVNGSQMQKTQVDALNYFGAHNGDVEVASQKSKGPKGWSMGSASTWDTLFSSSKMEDSESDTPVKPITDEDGTPVPDYATNSDTEYSKINGTNSELNGDKHPNTKTGEESEVCMERDSGLFSMSNSVLDDADHTSKKFCERWLDSLIMVLYDDLRVWTIYQEEVTNAKKQGDSLRKTALEWELLGELGLRLHYKEEAKEAFQKCLEFQRYSIIPYQELMKLYADEGDLQRTLQTAVHVAAYQHNEYADIIYPNAVAHQLFKLGRIHGHSKIYCTLTSMELPEYMMKLMESYLSYGRTFQVEGYDF